MLGDAVNTASRVQGVAPVNGVAVSEQTYRATERVFEWERAGAGDGEGEERAASVVPAAAGSGPARART